MNAEIDVKEVMIPRNTWEDDFQVLWSMLLGFIPTGSHEDSLESFYASQAKPYDGYRCRMLHGRPKLAERMRLKANDIWVDLAGGTGSNLEFFGEGIERLGKVFVVDLCKSLLDVARERVKLNGWENVVRIVYGDVCCDVEGIEEGTVDVVSFSYALTMIPDWKSAIDKAIGMLRPGGRICVCDFTVLEEQREMSRWFWRNLFRMDRVHLRKEHVEYLRTVSKEEHFETAYGGFPYVPSHIQCPYYVFTGIK